MISGRILLLLIAWLGQVVCLKLNRHQHAVLFTHSNLRVHDNVCLKYIEKESQYKYIPIFINDANFPMNQNVIASLNKNLNKIGGVLKCIDLEDASDWIGKRGIQSIISNKCHFEPHKSHFQKFLNIAKEMGVKVITLEDDLGVKLGNTRCFDSSLYKKHKITEPQMEFDIEFKNDIDEMERKIASADTNGEVLAGEDLALRLVSDYLSLGEKAFTLKYQDQYTHTIAHSPEHQQSVGRLYGSVTQGSAFFRGEVFSGLMAPLVTMGCLSPRLLASAQRMSVPGVFLPNRWLSDTLRDEAMRRDWLTHLAKLSTSRLPTYVRAKGAHSAESQWEYSFATWRGFAQRQAVMRSGDTELNRVSNRDNFTTVANNTAAAFSKPVLLLLHGFGGSIAQYSALAGALTAHFEVHAIDSLGFGQSAKPPISYNQYLWRDQALEYLQGVARSRGNAPLHVTVAGNSIGGFTAASVAAAIADSSTQKNPSVKSLKCDGLILFNSAGVIVNNTASSVRYVPECEPTFPAYSGPPSALLRVFGRGITAALRSRVTFTCRWLYPTKPDYVTSSGLVDDIVRDSFDPGASDVFAAGGKE